MPTIDFTDKERNAGIIPAASPPVEKHEIRRRRFTLHRMCRRDDRVCPGTHVHPSGSLLQNGLPRQHTYSHDLPRLLSAKTCGMHEDWRLATFGRTEIPGAQGIADQAVPVPDLTDEEHAAVIAALRKPIADNKFPLFAAAQAVQDGAGGTLGKNWRTPTRFERATSAFGG
jgi:hypothetical protein